MSNKYKKIIFSLFIALFAVLPQVSLAQGLKGAFGSGSPLADVQTRTGYGSEDIGTISGRVINVALTMVGIVFLLLMVYAGYLWMTAQGEDAQVKKATDIIKGTVIGLVLVLSAYAITIFVTQGLNPSPSATQTSTSSQLPACYSNLSTHPNCQGYQCVGLQVNTCVSNSKSTANPAGCCEWR